MQYGSIHAINGANAIFYSQLYLFK